MADKPDPQDGKSGVITLALRKMVSTADYLNRGDTADKPDPQDGKSFVITVTFRLRRYRPDYLNRGDTPIIPPQLTYDRDYLPALRAMVDNIVERYGGADEFDRFISANLAAVPADAVVATLVKDELQRLHNAIVANDIFGAISATATIERCLARPWTHFHRATGYKSGQARKRNAERRRELFYKIKHEVERAQLQNARLSRAGAIKRAAKSLGIKCSRNTFYRWEKLFGDP
ncbi:hypothetical protein [Immundisolibacter sp.]